VKCFLLEVVDSSGQSVGLWTESVLFTCHVPGYSQLAWDHCVKEHTALEVPPVIQLWSARGGCKRPHRLVTMIDPRRNPRWICIAGLTPADLVARWRRVREPPAVLLSELECGAVWRPMPCHSMIAQMCSGDESRRQRKATVGTCRHHRPAACCTTAVAAAMPLRAHCGALSGDSAAAAGRSGPRTPSRAWQAPAAMLMALSVAAPLASLVNDLSSDNAVAALVG